MRQNTVLAVLVAGLIATGATVHPPTSRFR
jgi:hypothetical protein